MVYIYSLVLGSLGEHSDSYGFEEGRIFPAGSNAANYQKYTGDRIATFMGWLSDVDEGGATCFTSQFSEGTVMPRKNSALVMLNINRRHARDIRMTHGGCPVLRGAKWIINDWIFAYDQWKSWSCGMDINSEFNIYSHFFK